MDRLTGTEARAHIDAKLRANPKVKEAYDKAERSLAARGYRKANLPVVIKRTTIVAESRQSVLERLVTYVVPTLVAQSYGESTGDGEIFMDPWDDGDNLTWEGTFYVTRYSDAAWALYDWQNDTRNETEYYMYYAEREGGERDRPEKEARRNILQRIVGLVETPVEAQYRFWARAKAFGYCYSGSCLGAATACALSGPAWGGCTAAWCTGAAVACGITSFLPS